MARDSYKVPELIYAPAKKGASNVLVMLVGSWGTGKTRSALEIAVGLADGGPICVADTEHGRALAYAEKFKFDYLPLVEPFRPELFENAAIVAQKHGAKVWICDNFSWEHIGPGGLLQWHAAELQRMAGDDYARREQMNMTAWINPKAAHTAMLQRFFQLNCHLILCVQAKKKILVEKNAKGKMAPVDKGWQPNCGEDIPYAMSTALLLSPGRPGYPTIIKPNEFLDPYIPLDRPLNADVGRAFLAWSRGETPVAPEPMKGSVQMPAAAEYQDDTPDDAPDVPAEDSPADVKTAHDLRDWFLATTDMRAHLELVDLNVAAFADLKQWAPRLWKQVVEPAVKASYLRNQPAPSKTPDKTEAASPATEPVPEELPL